MSKINPFDFLNKINNNGNNIVRDNPELTYPEFMVNRGMSLHSDTIFQAYQADQMHDIHDEAKMDYYIGSVSKRKRYSKWPKQVADDDVTFIQELYQVNRYIAEDYIKLMPDNGVDMLRSKYNKGGMV
jgi:hypothetical protein